MKNALSTTLYQLLSDNLPERAEKALIVDPDRQYTYSEIDREVDRVASLLASSGVQAGDRVVVQLRKSLREVVAMLAIAKVGGVIVNVNWQWTIDQLMYVVSNCSPRGLIVESGIANSLVGRDLTSPPHFVLVNGVAVGEWGIAWNDLSNGNTVSEVRRLETDLAMIIYTSGSTGRPKGVMLSHGNITAGARSVARYLSLDESDRLLSVLPYSFDYGLNQFTTMLLRGGTVVHQPVVMAAEIVKVLAKQEITGLGAVPPLWNQIVRFLAEAPCQLPKLRRVTNSGGKIPLNILRMFPQVFPTAEIYLMYGLTEAFRSTFLSPEKFGRKMGSIGQAVPGAEVFVIQSGRGVARKGESGELVHRGPFVSMGYWGMPEESRAKIRPCAELASIIGDEPVVYSGDIVEIEEDGDLWFVGRNDSMIKASGFRISPDEVEDLVSQSGMVAEVVAFGVADDDLGEVVHVAIFPLPKFSEEDLFRHCRTAMPRYMVPSRIHVWNSSMPRTASGKLARPEIVRATKEAFCS